MIMRKSLVISVLMGISLFLQGQENNLTFQFNRILFDDFVDTVERKVPVRIYYSPGGPTPFTSTSPPTMPLLKDYSIKHFGVTDCCS
jgi:hypothetical protein